jgi:ligand-binding SRPBCC domain-containing protein
MASVHLLERQQSVEIPIDEAFAFYGDARNLELITPPWLGFEVTTPGPIEMGPGTLIEYRLRLHRLPVRWRTRIEVWEPPRRFVDVQVKGPYSLWEHTHTFEADGPRATIIEDRVRYSIPCGPLGSLANRLLVRRDLRQIFDYRRDAAARELPAYVKPSRLAAGDALQRSSRSRHPG